MTLDLLPLRNSVLTSIRGKNISFYPEFYQNVDGNRRTRIWLLSENCKSCRKAAARDMMTHPLVITAFFELDAQLIEAESVEVVREMNTVDDTPKMHFVITIDRSKGDQSISTTFEDS
ncbi:hypothetical protein FPOA_03309 [Fusarium poae]|uniref:Uncharacterized protein n=1 Tax=Fusarium poae TaxID=36050 RepID=A0A1B8B9H0_FUSPO|nr:hypothetical protein FPOA_03309 [Fusarium poae]